MSQVNYTGELPQDFLDVVEMQLGETDGLRHLILKTSINHEVHEEHEDKQ